MDWFVREVLSIEKIQLALKVVLMVPRSITIRDVQPGDVRRIVLRHRRRGGALFRTFLRGSNLDVEYCTMTKTATI